MNFTRESAVERAKNDLAARLGIGATEVTLAGVTDKDFPDASLGAPAADEMAAQMISSGWQIGLEAAGRKFEYRGDKYQLRLHNFEGANYVVE
ncbi:MAG: hypothetical protein IPM59_00155 [Chloracidobacterium sp.]|nr:hypothetical protein [Chloracidobacterium sp.]